MEMLGIKSAPLSEANRLLAMAYVIHESEDRCPCGCGGLVDVTLEVDGFHEVEVVYCDARRAMDQYNKDNPDPEPGEVRFPVYRP